MAMLAVLLSVPIVPVQQEWTQLPEDTFEQGFDHATLTGRVSPRSMEFYTAAPRLRRQLEDTSYLPRSYCKRHDRRVRG